MNDKPLNLAGIYLYQSNLIYVNVSTSELLAQQAMYPTIVQQGRLDNWRLISNLLTIRHEENHFLNFLTSPYLAFIDDLNDIYNSAFIYLFDDWRSKTRRAVSMPIVVEAVSGLLSEDLARKVDVLSLLRRLRQLLLFESSTIETVLERLNFALGAIAASKGLPSVARVTSQLPYETFMGPTYLSTSHILETLARLIEDCSLYEFKASADTSDDWIRTNIFGIYQPGWYFLNSIGVDIGSVVLNLSLRGKFFPFLDTGEILLEDFHPALLSRRVAAFVDEQLEEYGPELSSPNTTAMESFCADIIQQIIKKFDLVVDADAFAHNQTVLESNFGAAFPSIFFSDNYQHYVMERSNLQRKRVSYFAEFRRNPLCLFEKPVVTVDEIIVGDGVLVRNNAILEAKRITGGLFTEYYGKLFGGSLADWIVYGDTSMLDISENVYNSLHQSAGREPKQNLREFLIKNFLNVNEVLF